MRKVGIGAEKQMSMKQELEALKVENERLKSELEVLKAEGETGQKK